MGQFNFLDLYGTVIWFFFSILLLSNCCIKWNTEYVYGVHGDVQSSARKFIIDLMLDINSILGNASAISTTPPIWKAFFIFKYPINFRFGCYFILLLLAFSYSLGIFCGIFVYFKCLYTFSVHIHSDTTRFGIEHLSMYGEEHRAAAHIYYTIYEADWKIGCGICRNYFSLIWYDRYHFSCDIQSYNLLNIHLFSKYSTININLLFKILFLFVVGRFGCSQRHQCGIFLSLFLVFIERAQFYRLVVFHCKSFSWCETQNRLIISTNCTFSHVINECLSSWNLAMPTKPRRKLIFFLHIYQYSSTSST